MRKKLTLFLVPAVLLAFFGAVVALDQDAMRIHPFVNSTADCMKCHSPGDTAKLKNPAYACDTYCMTCHKGLGNHHPVGIKLEGDPPDGVGPLTDRQKMACKTCHDVGSNRNDSTPWRSESLYESIFQKQRQYMTYFLVIKNNKGQMCNKCH
jgi:hypothetical protein